MGRHPSRARFVWMEVGADDDDPVRFSQRLLSGFTAINSDFADLTSGVAARRRPRMPLLEAFEAQMAELPRW
jgi:ATP/maltotriose-dependent transcriptional regulator MalT